jgi:hypothetical protein
VVLGANLFFNNPMAWWGGGILVVVPFIITILCNVLGNR